MLWSKKNLWLLPACIFLYACPFKSPVPLDEHPIQSVDTSFIGYWYGIIKDGSDFFGIEALDIRKQSDSAYNITRYGKAIKGNMILPDTAYFTGYISRLGEQAYMNIESHIVEIIPGKKKEAAINKSRIFYLAAIELNHDTLTVKTVTDNFAGINPRFPNPSTLRQTILSLSAKNKNIFDDVYKLTYRKMERPF